MTYATVSYTRDAEGRLVQSPHRTLTHPEVHAFVYGVEASTDNGRGYAGNGLRWDNPDDARIWGSDLGMRWFGATNIRVVRYATFDTTVDPEVVDQLF